MFHKQYILGIDSNQISLIRELTFLNDTIYFSNYVKLFAEYSDNWGLLYNIRGFVLLFGGKDRIYKNYREKKNVNRGEVVRK